MNSQQFYKMLDEVKEKGIARFEEQQKRQELIHRFTNKENWSYCPITKIFTVDCAVNDLHINVYPSVMEEYLCKKVYWDDDKPKEGYDYVLLSSLCHNNTIMLRFIE